jgi:molybdopterin converting factor small subunit
MVITVRFTGMLRRLAEHDTIQMDLQEGSTLRSGLIGMQERLPQGFSEDVLKPILNSAQKVSILLLNRSSIHTAEQLETELHDGDIIAFATPMEGG